MRNPLLTFLGRSRYCSLLVPKIINVSDFVRVVATDIHGLRRERITGRRREDSVSWHPISSFMNSTQSDVTV
ncbi:hypothetical protein PENTCL1PPCAC_25779 [Pristionchus entomophagus]|uniref:Uncharacterized protein n=1 Tax=Pristionchus entomophagus TaxID=358040 RepID=A0AAV5U9P9_9BILA|nr:hypothetical protein PENTCL1PPCAC_25779 [Pristionchus entomophagus]